MRMSVSDTDDGMTAIQVKIFLTILVPDFATFALHDVHVEEGIYVE
jgi:hypothetical protein